MSMGIPCIEGRNCSEVREGAISTHAPIEPLQSQAKQDRFFCRSRANKSSTLCKKPLIPALWRWKGVAPHEGKTVKTSKYGEVKVIPLSRMDEYLARPEFQQEEPPEKLAMTIGFNMAFYGSWFPEGLKKEFDEAHQRLERQGKPAGPHLMNYEAMYAPNEGRFLRWIQDRMSSWNKRAEATLRGSLSEKLNLENSLGVTQRWEDRLSPNGWQKVHGLFAKTDELTNRRGFEWEKDINRLFEAGGIFGRVIGSQIISGLTAKFAGKKEESFQLSSDLFEAGRDPEEVLKALRSDDVVYKPLSKEWQRPVWDFLRNNLDPLSSQKVYWFAVGAFLENNPEYIPSFIEERERWVSRLPKEYQFYGDLDVANSDEVVDIFADLFEKDKIPPEHKLTAYHYVLTDHKIDREKDYAAIKDVQRLEERLMADHLQEIPKEDPNFYTRGAELGNTLFLRRAREWGAQKTIDFMKGIFPEEMHAKLTLSFRVIRLFIDLDPKEIEAFLAELQDPTRRDLEAVRDDPLWKNLWGEFVTGFSLGLTLFASQDIALARIYNAALATLPVFLLGHGKKREVEKFYYANHPYARLYNMPDDIRPTGEISFVSVDEFKDPRLAAHIDKRNVTPLNGKATQWKKVKNSSNGAEATHGEATSAFAVGERFGLAPHAGLYIAPVDFEREQLPSTLARNLEEVIRKKRDDPAIGVVGMSFGLAVPHVFRKEVARSRIFQKLKRVAEALHSRGVALVASSGNTGSEELINMAGFLPHVQLIGSLDSELTEDRSDDWRSDYTTGGDKVNPVRFLAHADPLLRPSEGEKMEWDWGAGTSFAQPHFSGVLLLMKSVNPSLTWDEIYKILEETRDMGGTKDKWDRTVKPVLTIDPIEAIAVAAKRPGSTYHGERLERLLKHLGYRHQP